MLKAEADLSSVAGLYHTKSVPEQPTPEVVPAGDLHARPKPEVHPKPKREPFNLVQEAYSESPTRLEILSIPPK